MLFNVTFIIFSSSPLLKYKQKLRKNQVTLMRFIFPYRVRLCLSQYMS